MQYRADIDGLRALAVLAVVLFHLGFDTFAGGYVGVDVFFVISGYLITTIVARKVAHGTFELSDFYLRRVRRLVPALVATVIVTTIGAAVVMVPLDFSAYARSAVAAVGSVANFVFFAEAGYWDSSAELKPLLHTWSLGVEEQFYLLWPLLVIGLVRLRHRVSLVVSTAVLVVVGLAGAIWLFAASPEAAFYLLPARVWQFAAGALVGQVSQSWLRQKMDGGRGAAVTAAGLAAILVSVLWFDAGTPFPGVAVVLPTVGAVLAIAGGVGGLVAPLAAVLENGLAQWVGRVSYSLYLVHWPIISLYRYATDADLSGTEQAWLAVAMLPAAALLHHGVELRLYQRSGSEHSATPVHEGLAAARVLSVSAVVALVMVHPWTGDGWAWRTPDATLTTRQIEQGMRDRFDLVAEGCSVRALDDAERCDLDRPLQVLLLGNSHEPDGYNFFVGAYGDRDDVNLISFGTTNGCDLSVVDEQWTGGDERCDAALAATFEALLPRLDVLVYAANRPFFENKQSMLELVRSLKDRRPSLQVVTLGGYINTHVPCSRLVNEAGTTRACALPENVEYTAAEQEQQPLFDGFMAVTDHFVDRWQLLCSDPHDVTTCRTETSEGVPMAWDEHHLSLEFALEAGASYAASTLPPLLPPEEAGS